jgi:hypothetical protein
VEHQDDGEAGARTGRQSSVEIDDRVDAQVVPAGPMACGDAARTTAPVSGPTTGTRT